MPNKTHRTPDQQNDGQSVIGRLRRSTFGIDRSGETHFFVVFGRRVRRVPIAAAYLRMRDAEYQLRVYRRREEERRTAQDIARVSTPAPHESDRARPYYFADGWEPRRSIDELVAMLAPYDIVSFDIFDTALYRCVEDPTDVFRILGAQIGVSNFPRVRRAAEARARERNDQQHGTREVTLSDIYDVLVERYGAEHEWATVEAELEIELQRPNPDIKAVYDRLRATGKRIIFMSDMYLPKAVLERMLMLNGYQGFERIYVSNEHGRRKGDGTLQALVRAEYGPHVSIIHVGDVLAADVEKSEAAGLAAVHHHDQHVFQRENNMETLAGSIYTAVINNELGAGTWSHGLHYTHGFRVGGILTVGFCEFVERLARDKSVDRILFCGRDCDVIARAYKRFYGGLPSQYVDTSRYALTGITLDVNYEEYFGRSFLRWFDDSNNTRTLEQILIDAGFDYLVEHLEPADLERFLFPRSVMQRRIEQFMWEHRHIVEEHNATSVAAATEYFSKAVGDAERVLVVDVGWSGTSVTALQHFFRTALPEGGPEVLGALMCTSRTEQLTDAMSEGLISAYVYSPFANMDFTRFMMPAGRVPVRAKDLLHYPLELMFTEPKATVTGYAFDDEGCPTVRRGNNAPDNADQIAEIQRGILDFVRIYLDYSKGYSAIRPVSPYVAFNPLRKAIETPAYSYDVYKDFLYDATPALFGPRRHIEHFGDLFEVTHDVAMERQAVNISGERGQILFVQPEMNYDGSPKSLLRLCNVAISLGYEPVVWMAIDGPFAHEFEDAGIAVQVVPAGQVDDQRLRELVVGGVKLAICNTVKTDAYVRTIEGRIPLVWYVREASNLPDFFRSHPERIDTVRHSRSICAVSEYAAEQIAPYTDGPVDVVHNSVEDVSSMAAPYRVRERGRHRFIQLGTIEQRKGYDLFVAAYKSLPPEYRDRAELHFAGGFISSGASFASYVFGQMDGEDHIHFHGLISEERAKIELLSQMDTVVVASRDESFSLVALEGAMLSKPIIVTENVGAKYLVDDTNGLVVESGSVTALRDAFIKMIDSDDADLLAMGTESRRKYDERASMDAHRRDLGEFFARRIASGAGRKPTFGTTARGKLKGARRSPGAVDRTPLLVSLTSFPERIPSIGPCIDSLLGQSLRPDEVLLWLSTEQFPGKEADLPGELLERTSAGLTIRWVSEDLKPHKKYYYVMQERPEATVVIVDDDVTYHDQLVESLYGAHIENPRAVIADRANLMLFRPDGTMREYDSWVYNCDYLRGTSTYQLHPTGIGGVLYPAGSIPSDAFDADAIAATSVRADDIWLKLWATANGYPVWMPRQRTGYKMIAEAQSVALWRANSFRGENDVALKAVLGHLEERFGIRQALADRLRGVRPDGAFVGLRELAFTPLI